MSENVNSNLSLELWRALTNTFEVLEKSHSKRMTSFKLTTPQISVLNELYINGSLPLNIISKKLNVTGANITCIMDNLQKRNLAERVSSTNDRRIINAGLTKEGKSVVKKLTPLFAKSIDEATQNLTDDEKKTLLELLKKLTT